MSGCLVRIKWDSWTDLHTALIICESNPTDVKYIKYNSSLLKTLDEP